MAADPGTRIGEIDLSDAGIPDPSAAGRDAAAVSGATGPAVEESANATEDEVIAGGTAFGRAMAAIVEDDPDAPALTSGDDEISYSDLQARAARIARVLIGRGCGPGTGVVVRLERGLDAVAAIWAILAAGAAVAEAPAAERAEATLGLITGPPPTTASDIEWLRLDDPDLNAEITAASARPVTYADRTRDLLGTDPAYLGGDTVTFDELATLVNRVCARTDLTFESRTLRHGAPADLAAVVEVTAAGAVGATLVTTTAPAGELADVLAQEWVTHLFTVPDGVAELDGEPLEDLHAVVLDSGPAADAVSTLSWVNTLVTLGDLR